MKRKIMTIALISALLATLPVSSFAAPGGAPPGSGSHSGSTSVSYSGATTIQTAATESDRSYSSDNADQNALLIDTSEDVSIMNPEVTKSGDSSGGDDCNFYGINSAIMVKGGSTTTISGGTVNASATGANGVFSYGGNGGQNGSSGDGTTVNISDTVINTTGNNGGGIMTTGGGVMNAENLTVTTSGNSSAAIRTDRGGGTVHVNGGSYASSGLGSPAIYSTADISVTDAELISSLSEGVCIEGKNSVSLTNCDLSANNTKCNGNASFLDTIMMYQSMSGDASSGTSKFTMTGGTLNSENGHVFHVTNTNAEISLNGVQINNHDQEQVLLSVCDDGWNGGSNIATVNTSGQTLSGDILVGDNSSLNLNFNEGSSYTGKISGEIVNAKGDTVSTSVGTVNVSLDSDSKWYLTGDTEISSFSGEAASVISNGYTLYVNGSALAGTTSEEDSDTDQSDTTTDNPTDDPSDNPSDEPSDVNPFTDVQSSDYFFDPVKWAVANLITTGTTSTTFSPDENCTRAQMVTFLWRAAGSPEPTTSSNPFTDVEENAYYYKAVLWAVEQGITTGTTATTFSPDATVTRAQSVTFLWRMEGSQNVTVDNSFTDVNADTYYSGAVDWAVKDGITTGKAVTSFAPEDACTRAQIVTFLYRDFEGENIK